MDKEAKLLRLEEELKRYEKKLKEMERNWAATKGGSRYGDEYLEVQCKVYRDMISQVSSEILKLKKGA